MANERLPFIQARVPIEMAAEVDQLAERLGVRRSEIVRRAVAELLARAGDDRKVKQPAA